MEPDGRRQGGVHITDVTNASRTQLMNLETLAWDKEMLEAFGIPEAMLPKIRSSSEKYGVAKERSIQGRGDFGNPWGPAGGAGGANLL